MEFKEYLNKELKKPSSNPDFNYSGNSPRAIMTRGLMHQVHWEFKNLLPSIKSDIVYFWNGFDTPVSYFFYIIAMPFLLPFLPFLRAFFAVRSARKEYFRYYDEKLNNYE